MSKQCTWCQSKLDMNQLAISIYLIGQLASDLLVVLQKQEKGTT